MSSCWQTTVWWYSIRALGRPCSYPMNGVAEATRNLGLGKQDLGLWTMTNKPRMSFGLPVLLCIDFAKLNWRYEIIPGRSQKHAACMLGNAHSWHLVTIFRKSAGVVSCLVYVHWKWGSIWWTSAGASRRSTSHAACRRNLLDKKWLFW
jgi:hypothetical protein